MKHAYDRARYEPEKAARAAVPVRLAAVEAKAKDNADEIGKLEKGGAK